MNESIDARTIAELLKAVAHPTRVMILQELVAGTKCVSDMEELLPARQANISQHLAVLKAAGLVIDRAEGARRVYRVDAAGLAVLRAWLDRFWDGALDAFKSEAERTLTEDN